MKRLFVLEVETGLIDGFYNTEAKNYMAMMDGIKKYWEKENPHFTYVICNMEENANFPEIRFIQSRIFSMTN